MAEEFVYHGSPVPGLRELAPKEAGFGKSRVYATDDLTLATVFMGKGRNSWQAEFDMGKDGVAYFHERVEGVLDRWFKGQAGSIYVLPKGGSITRRACGSTRWPPTGRSMSSGRSG